MQNHHSRGSSMNTCTVLLEPTVTFIHLQQCDELLDKFLVGFSIYTGFKKQRSNYSMPQNGTTRAYFLWMQRSSSVIMWVFNSSCSVVLAIYVTTEVEPRFFYKKTPALKHQCCHELGFFKPSAVVNSFSIVSRN